MVNKRNQVSLPDDHEEPWIDHDRLDDVPIGRDQRGAPGGGLSDPARPWRQWYPQHPDLDTSPPLEVSAPKRPQWGRYLYMLIILAVAYYALNLLYTNVFWLNASGVVGGQQFNLSPSQPVSVENVLVEPAESVEEGQTLIELASPSLQEGLAQTLTDMADLRARIAAGGEAPGSANSIGSLEADVQALESRRRFLREKLADQQDEVSSTRELVYQGAIAPGHLRQAERDLREIRAEYEQAGAELNQSRARLEQLREADSEERNHAQLSALEQLEQSIRSRMAGLDITAPAAGVVAELNVEPGETIQPGDMAVRIVQREELRSFLYFPPAASDRLEQGKPLALTLPNGNRVATRVSRIYPSMQAVPREARPSGDEGDSASLVVAVEPADETAEATLKQLESGTPVRARVSRWEIPDAVTELRARIAESF